MVIYFNFLNIAIISFVSIIIFSIIRRKNIQKELIYNTIFLLLFLFLCYLYLRLYNPVDIYHSYTAHQSQAKTTLKYLVDRKSDWEPNNVKDYLNKNNFLPHNYTIIFDNELTIPPRYGQQYSLPNEYRAYYKDENCFLIYMIGNNDRDNMLDIWAIDSFGNLFHIQDDLGNPY